MAKFFVCFSCFIALVFISCEKTDDDGATESDDNLYVEAYLYVDEPANSIKLHKMSGQNSLTPFPVSEAEIELWQDEELFHFHKVDGMPGTYNQTNDSIFISSGSPIYLNISHNDKSYRIMTSVPPKIQGLEMDVTDITLDLNNPEEVLATLTWQPLDGYDYCIFIRNSGYDIFPVPDPESTHSQSAFYSLITENRIELKSSDFTHHGQYQVYVTAVNSVYANFYNNPANIAQLAELNSGLPMWGVFTAFNGSSIHIHVN